MKKQHDLILRLTFEQAYDWHWKLRELAATGPLRVFEVELLLATDRFLRDHE